MAEQRRRPVEKVDGTDTPGEIEARQNRLQRRLTDERKVSHAGRKRKLDRGRPKALPVIGLFLGSLGLAGAVLLNGISESGGQGTGNLEGDVKAGIRADAITLFADPRRINEQPGSDSRASVIQRWDAVFFGDGFDPNNSYDAQTVELANEVFAQLHNPEGREELKRQNRAYFEELAQRPSASIPQKNRYKEIAAMMDSWIDGYGKKCSQDTSGVCDSIGNAMTSMMDEGYNMNKVRPLTYALENGPLEIQQNEAGSQ